MKKPDVVRAFLRTNVLFYTSFGGLLLSLFGTVWSISSGDMNSRSHILYSPWITSGDS
jgi:hypothetical protein